MKAKNLPKEWRTELRNHKNLILLSLAFLASSVALIYVAGNYVDSAESSAVPDLILGFLPAVNLSFLFIYGYVLAIAVLLIYPFLFKIKEFHVILSQFSLLVLIRSFFISLTHLKIPADAIVTNTPYLYHLLLFENDLFFSGHAAIPFLGFLLFRKQKIGIFFLIATIVLATSVLFMHVHYSIDVFAAYFITYGSYKIGDKIFNKNQ